MAEQIFEFCGIPSGDHESFCWDVTAEEYQRLTGKEPHFMRESFFNEGYYRLYPGGEIPDFVPTMDAPMRIKLTICHSDNGFKSSIEATKLLDTDNAKVVK